LGSPGYAHAPFSPKLLTRAYVRMHTLNIRAKFEDRIALPVPEIIAVVKKIWAVPGYALAPFSPEFFMGLCSDGPCEYICQI